MEEPTRKDNHNFRSNMEFQNLRKVFLIFIITGLFARISYGLLDVNERQSLDEGPEQIDDRDAPVNGTNHANKSPIQILPSRFPPPIEKLLERIQNYFSTYNHPELQNRPPTTQMSQVTATDTTKPTQASTTEMPPAVEEITTESITEEDMEITTENGTNYFDIYIQ